MDHDDLMDLKFYIQVSHIQISQYPTSPIIDAVLGELHKTSIYIYYYQSPVFVHSPDKDNLTVGFALMSL